MPKDTDGISFLPALLGRPDQKEHEYLYWEYHSQGGRQAVRMGDWKGVRYNVRNSPDGPVALFNLKTDIGEKRDVAADHPEIVKRIRRIMAGREKSDNPKWNF